MSEKVTSEPEYYNQYLTYMDYFATGEGRTIEIFYALAMTEKEARQKHLDKFYPNDAAAQNYFGPGVEVMDAKSKKAKDLIKHIFKFGAGLHKDLIKAGCEFHFKFHFNHS